MTIEYPTSNKYTGAGEGGGLNFQYRGISGCTTNRCAQRLMNKSVLYLATTAAIDTGISEAKRRGTYKGLLRIFDL